MSNVVGHIIHLHNHGFREIYHIEDRESETRMYLYCTNDAEKICKFIQIGPANGWFSRDIPYNHRKIEFKKICEFRDRFKNSKQYGYIITRYYDAAMLHGTAHEDYGMEIEESDETDEEG